MKRIIKKSLFPTAIALHLVLRFLYASDFESAENILNFSNIETDLIDKVEVIIEDKIIINDDAISTIVKL